MVVGEIFLEFPVITKAFPKIAVIRHQHYDKRLRSTYPFRRKTDCGQIRILIFCLFFLDGLPSFYALIPINAQIPTFPAQRRKLLPRPNREPFPYRYWRLCVEINTQANSGINFYSVLRWLRFRMEF